jgi:GT2 family glycosyltransferase
MRLNKLEISVIIPNRNRKDTLIQVLRALEDQTFPRELFEVVVVDDRSTDGSPDFLTAFQHETCLNFTWLQGEGRGAASARNSGLRTAEGERVLFLDADTIPRQDVLSRHIQWQEHYGYNTCIVGRVIMSDKLRKRQQGRLNDTATRYDNHSISELEWQDYRTANTSLNREKCLLIGGFDEALPAAEDTEFASRLEKLGMRFIFVNDITVVHHHPMSVDGFFRKGALYGKAVALWYLKAPEQRMLLIKRYGVFAPEADRRKKVKYIVRALLVNRVTVPALSMFGKLMRWIWFKLSDGLFVAVFRYHLRHAFRMNLRNV